MVISVVCFGDMGSKMQLQKYVNINYVYVKYV